MAYLDADEVYKAYEASKEEAAQWRKDYKEYERLADNGLLDTLDENLPETNDGSLAASLFKLAKRVIRKDQSGKAIPIDRGEAWMTVLGNIIWNKKILPKANSKATPRRKNKDIARKAAIYGSQPSINLMVSHGLYDCSDYVVPYAQDCLLEAGKDSDLDSDIMFWDIYYTKNQLQNMTEAAKDEIKDGDGAAIPQDTAYAYDTTDSKDYPSGVEPKTIQGYQDKEKQQKKSKAIISPSAETEASADKDAEPPEQFNNWNVDELEAILASDPEEQRDGDRQPREEQDKGHKKTGYHFVIAFQRGVAAPMMMMHVQRKCVVRQWFNPDPTGDPGIRWTYCYQDFVNPYGVGIVKLAGGTQNVLDYMRQADVLATQLGLRPPKQIQGDEDQVDMDSLVYAEDANWVVGNAKVERMELANGVYEQLPGRINMYQTSLQKMIPLGDTSISAQTSGDSQQSKTPAGVKLAAANLSIDDEEFSENMDEFYAANARSCINLYFANMQGTDVLKLSDDEREQLEKAGYPFDLDNDMKDGQDPDNPNAQPLPPSNEINLNWDEMRATFDFEMNPTGDIMTDQEQLQILTDTAKSLTPQVTYYMAQDGWKVNIGELYYGIFSKVRLENFDAIITKMTDEEKQKAAQAPFPIIDPPQIRLTGQIPTAAMPSALASGGVNLPQGTPLGSDMIDMGDVLKDPATTVAEKAQIKQLAGIRPDDPNNAAAAQQAADGSGQPDMSQLTLTPNEQVQAHLKAGDQQLKADQQQHQQSMDKAKLALEVHSALQPETAQPAQPATAQAQQKSEQSTQQAPDVQAQQQEQAIIQQIMQHYNVDQNTATAMRAAEKQGYSPQEILLSLKRNQVAAKRGAHVA